MSEPTQAPVPLPDPKVAFVEMVKSHLACKHIKSIARVLTADQYAGFWKARFAFGSSGRWNNEGGLAEAMLMGYKVLRIFTATAKAAYTDKFDEDRIVAIYLSLIIARWAEVRTFNVTFDRINPCSVSTVAVANACAFAIDLTPAEVQALTHWYRGRMQMLDDHEGFTVEWWIISETMNWLFQGNRS